MTNKPKVKVLTRLRINEVSLVDRGAGEQCRVVISKRDDSADNNRPVEMPDNERRYWKALGATALRHAEERYAKDNGTGAADHEPADDEPENPFTQIFCGTKISESSARALAKVAAELNKGSDSDDNNDGLKRDGREAVDDIVEGTLDQDDDGKPVADGRSDHPAHKVADMLVQSGSHKTREDALAHLLHNPRGAALLRRLTKSEDAMDYTQKLRDLAKRTGAVAIAKVIVDDDNAYGISEHELTDLVTECAKREHPQLTDAQAFVKMFTDQSEAGVMLRKAFNVVKTEASADSVTSYPFPKF